MDTIGQYLETLKGSDTDSEAEAFFMAFMGEMLTLRYHNSLGGFALDGKIWGYYFTKDEFAKLCNSILENYAPDEVIKEINFQRDNPSRIKSTAPKKKISRAGHIYLIKGGGFYKIGLTANIDNRMSQISPKLPFETELIHTIEVSDMERAEQYLHNKFSSSRVNGEWFRLEDSDVEWIKAWDGII